jgi:hypothetical protein
VARELWGPEVTGTFVLRKERPQEESGRPMKKPTKKVRPTTPTLEEALLAYDAALHGVIDMSEVSEKSSYFRRQLARDMKIVCEFIEAAGPK